MTTAPQPPVRDRDHAMAARAHRLPVLRTEVVGDKLRVTVQFRRSRWQRWLGASDLCERTFALDPIGQQVYAACDGTRTVAAIAQALAASHHLGPAEAELAVTTFLKTLMSRGLVAMEVSREGKDSSPA